MSISSHLKSVSGNHPAVAICLQPKYVWYISNNITIPCIRSPRHADTPFFSVPNIYVLSLSRTNLVTTGQSTSAPLERNTITTAEQRCLSGRSPKTGWRGSYYPFYPSLLIVHALLWFVLHNGRIHHCVPAYLCLFHREQRQKEATKTAVVNSFPKDRDYRREAMQTSAAPGFTGASKYCINYFNTH